MAKRSHVISVALMGDHKDLQQAFRNGERSAEGFVSKMRGAAASVAGFFFDVAKKVATAIAGIATVIAGLAIKGGISRVLDTEDAIVQMQRLGMSVEEIEAAIDGVDKTFDGTVFTNPEGFALFGRLQGLGQELDEIPGTIKTIADMAAHGNVPLDQMSSIFERVISNGRLSNEEINRLADAGIPLTELAAALGMTVEELRAAASEGKITSDMFLEATGNIEMFDGAAQAAGDTTRGAFSNVRAQLSKLGELLVGPMFGENGPMVRLFKAIRQALIDIRPIFKEAGEAIGNWLVPKMEALAEWLSGGGLPNMIQKTGDWFSRLKDRAKELWPHIQAGIDFVKDLFDRLREGENPLGGVTTGLMMLGGPMALLARELLPALGPLFAAILPPLIQLANDAAPALAEILTVLVDTLLPPLVSLLEWLTDLFTAHPELILAVVGAIAAFKTVTFVIGLINGIKVAFIALKTAMMANPFALLAAAVVALAILIYKNWDEIVAFLKRVWDWIKDTAASVGKWLSDKFWEAVEFIKNLFLNFTPLGLIIKNFDKIKELATGVKNWIVEKWNQTIDWLKGVPGRISSAVAGLFQRAKDLAVAAKDWIRDRWNDIVENIKKIPSRIANAASGMWDGIKDAFKGVINTIIGWWNNFRISLTVPTNSFTELIGLAGKGFTIDTPNIPKLHSGGIFVPPPGKDEGLALLRRGERVQTPAQARMRDSKPPVVINLTVNAGLGTDGHQVGQDILEVLQDLARSQGPLDLQIRAA